jgi:enoyl-CoA hydratase/carnithine racemase
MSGFEQVRYELGDDGVLTLTLDRPERLNAFTDQMGDELIAAFDRADGDDAVRAIVVTGAGRAFCAGSDLGEGGATFDYADREAPGEALPDSGGRVALRIYESTKFVVAAINGPAVGVGVTMTLPMDVRLVARGARLGFVFTRRGVVTEACSSWFLPRVVGISTAMEWVATGRLFDAEESVERGLARSLHEPAELLPAAYELAREVAREAAPVSVALSRQLLWRMLGAADPREAHRADSLGMSLRGRSADAREGVTAFLEKRPPRFEDRVSTDLPDLFDAAAAE